VTGFWSNLSKSILTISPSIPGIIHHPIIKMIINPWISIFLVSPRDWSEGRRMDVFAT